MKAWNVSWDPDARAEYKAMMHTACGLSRSSAARRDAMLAGVDDAIQAHRYWAVDTEREMRSRGALSLITAFARAERTVLVAFDDKLLAKSADVGIRRIDDAGNSYHERALFYLLAWEDLEAKRIEYLRQVRSYSEDVALMDKLLALREMVENAANPQDACDRLGMSIDDYLMAPPRAA